eukprot:CAMPEP_0118948024 /NCGR_PEP_ID=MMETSP1169-20130426/47128_1 /TAXON_ID=36882 /ORGANISM="Pyramimonas obovata, Strain CCMP722" /LENGTH=474 /DNA_ID=CAMNT_0006894365 /DNA_START=308 /DNA_END=1732 /DNA_ORIENTATION=-
MQEERPNRPTKAFVTPQFKSSAVFDEADNEDAEDSQATEEGKFSERAPPVLESPQRKIMVSGVHDPNFLKAKILREGFGNRMSQYAKVLSDAAKRSHDHTAAMSAAQDSKPSKLSPTGRKYQKQVQCTKSGDIHVVYSSNSHEYGAMLASAYSALRNTYNPNRLLFHFVIPASADADELCSMAKVYSDAYPDVICPVDAALPKEFSTVRQCATSLWAFEPGKGRSNCMCGLHFHIVQFDPSQYPMMDHIRRNSKDRKELLSVMNFARNFIDDILLPWGVERIIYMDVDTIVQGDLRDLWLTRFRPGNFFAPAHTCNQPWGFWFNFKSWVIFNSLLKEDGCAVNAGVYLLDVKQYASHKIQDRIAKLISIHEQRLEGKMKGIWRRGVHQPSFVLALYNHTQRVDAKWNMGQLGWDDNLKQEDIASSHILHWNGQRKPWNPDGLYKHFWLPYALPLPAPRNALLLGNCLVKSGGEE